MQPTIEVTIYPDAEIHPELNRAIDALDHLAFDGPGGHADSEPDPVRWADPDWIALGRVDGELVTQLCLVKREILVGGEALWVAGVGGVATHPKWQRRGLASQIMRAATDFVRQEMKVPFALLVCAQETLPFYESLGWQRSAKELTFVQDGKSLPLYTCVMTLPLTDQPWPPGAIHLRGAPW